MAERGWLGWRFKNRTPLWFVVIVAVLLADTILHFGLLMTVSSWAQSSRDAMHSYRVPFRDGVNYFVDPWLGRYLDSWWLSVGLFALLILLLVLNRNRLERE
jgi:hypothetical protein